MKKQGLIVAGAFALAAVIGTTQISVENKVTGEVTDLHVSPSPNTGAFIFLDTITVKDQKDNQARTFNAFAKLRSLNCPALGIKSDDECTFPAKIGDVATVRYKERFTNKLGITNSAAEVISINIM